MTKASHGQILMPSCKSCGEAFIGLRTQKYCSNRCRWKDPEQCEKTRNNTIKQFENPKMREVFSNITKERWKDPEYAKRTNESHKITLRDSECHKRMSDAAKKRWSDDNYRMKWNESSKLSWSDLNRSKKIGDALRNKWQSDYEFVNKMTDIRRKTGSDPNFRLKQSIAAKISHSDHDVKQKMSASHKALWQDDKYAMKMIKCLRIKPNKPEIWLIDWLDRKYPNEWKYVGDGQLWIGGKNPDFMNINGKKQVIEIYGNYWHKDENPQDRIGHYKEYGFDCKVIWQNELKEDMSLSF